MAITIGAQYARIHTRDRLSRRIFAVHVCTRYPRVTKQNEKKRKKKQNKSKRVKKKNACQFSSYNSRRAQRCSPISDLTFSPKGKETQLPRREPHRVFGAVRV